MGRWGKAQVFRQRRSRLKDDRMRKTARFFMTLAILLCLLLCGENAQAAATDVVIADYAMAEADYAEVLSYYQKLPEGCRRALETYGWTIRFTDMTMDEVLSYDRQVLLSRYPNAKVCVTAPVANTTGITKYGTRTIYINREKTESFGEGITEQTLLHECGHAIDRILYYEATATDVPEMVHISYSDFDASFPEIFTKERVHARAYAQSKSREYFADAFAAMILNPEGTRKVFRETCGFITTAMDQYLETTD